jgi:dTDP-4-amino-4,6-dideoxygalactose transaminase
MEAGIPIARTSLTDEEVQSALEPLRSGWLVQGPKVKEFEDKWRSFTGAPEAAAVTSCTTGLHLALETAGIGPGDEVIVPAFTWISTANVVEHTGATVVFCDIDINTFNIDVELLPRLLTPRTKAIIPVHLFGLAADMKAVIDFAKAANLFVLEDAACGFGATLHGQHVGYFGDAGVFSFHPRKAITTGEGGMVTSQSEELITKLRRLRDHGAELSDLQRHLGPKPYLLADHTEAGFNQRMTDIQGALGSAQMDRACEIVTERRRLAAIYDATFADLPWLEIPSVPDGYGHGYQSYPCLFMPEATKAALVASDEAAIKDVNTKRNQWMDDLQNAGISTRPATHAVHMLTFYRDKYDLLPMGFPKAFAANDCSISLPLFHGLSDEEQAKIIEIVRSAPF